MAENDVKIKTAVIYAKYFQVNYVSFVLAPLSVQENPECEVLIYKSVPPVTVQHHSTEPRDANM